MSHLPKKLVGRMKKVGDAIGATAAALAIARQRTRSFGEMAHRAAAARRAAETRADELRAAGDEAAARRQDRKAARKKKRVQNARARHEVWTGRVKALVQRKADLKAYKADLERKLAEWKRRHQPRVVGNKIVGGDPHERLQFALVLAAHRCAAGQRPNRYSMPGAFSARFLIVGEPYGYRTDCSQFGSSVFYACGLPDPGGEGFDDGWTGSIEQKGVSCSKQYAMTHAGCAILYGSPGRTHHVEWSVGDGTDRTVGHGSPPIDFGVFDLFGDGNYRCFKFDLT